MAKLWMRLEKLKKYIHVIRNALELIAAIHRLSVDPNGHNRLGVNNLPDFRHKGFHKYNDPGYLHTASGRTCTGSNNHQKKQGMGPS